MLQQEINELLRRFFTATGCTITNQDNDTFSVQLTIDMDKKMMNRPFYWHYLEKVGGEPKPMSIKLSTSLNAMDDKHTEFIHFGSPRLHQIYDIINEYGRFIRLYEHPTNIQSSNLPLHPWFHVNLKVNYQCDKKRESLHSIGVNLLNGEMKQNFHQLLSDKNVKPKIPDGCYTLSGMITPKSGFKRIQAYIESQIEKEDFTWAYDAEDKMNYDISLLESFYENHEEKPNSYFVEFDAIQDQYNPKITAEVINGGMFYLLPKLA